VPGGRAAGAGLQRAADIVRRFAGARVLVVGDLMLDQFLWGRVERISPEAPVPVVRLERESHHLGGAGNVARNIVALGGQAVPVGTRGDDPDGETLERFCRAAGVDTGGLVVGRGRPTTVKTRVIAHHQQVVRVDREVDDPLDEATAAAVRDRALRLIDGAAALVISDYEKGCLSAGLLGAILPEAARRGLPVVIDPKIRLFSHYRPATVVTPNAREAMAVAGAVARTDVEIEAVGRSLLARLGNPWLLITRGERGMLLIENGGPAMTIPSAAREVFDVTGAGDTVVATLALGLAAGAAMPEAAAIANAAAGVVVGKVGTSEVSVGELLQAAGREAGSAADDDPQGH
jgi:D-beta-D-heptose 7-phosphate kinase/D-beta-D-heptose 1-phosphate adenosyltransferase